MQNHFDARDRREALRLGQPQPSRLCFKHHARVSQRTPQEVATKSARGQTVGRAVNLAPPIPIPDSDSILETPFRKENAYFRRSA